MVICTRQHERTNSERRKYRAQVKITFLLSKKKESLRFGCIMEKRIKIIFKYNSSTSLPQNGLCFLHFSWSNLVQSYKKYAIDFMYYKQLRKQLINN